MLKRYARVLVFPLLLALVTGCSAQQPARSVSGSPQGPLLLVDEDFWGDYQRTRDAVVARIAKEDFRGILIDAPKHVDLSSRDTAPVVGYFVRSLREDRVLRQESQMVAVAVNQQSGQVYVGLALDPGKQRAPSPAPPRSEDPGEGTTLNLFTSDLRRVLQLPWEPATYRVSFLLGSRLSNEVIVDFTAPPAAARQPRQSEAAEIRMLRNGTSGCILSGDLPSTGSGYPITVVATGVRDAGPWTVVVNSPGSAVSGAPPRFNLDLLRAPGMPRAAQDYWVYTFSGNLRGGPVNCTAGALRSR